MLKEMERTVIKYLRKKGKKYKEIGDEIGCHRETASKVMKEPVDKKYERQSVENQVTPYRKEIEEWITSGIKVNRMLEKVREELAPPYSGCRSVFYDQVSKIRKELKEKAAETFIRFEGLPGEYLQIDWGGATRSYLNDCYA